MARSLDQDVGRDLEKQDDRRHRQQQRRRRRQDDTAVDKEQRLAAEESTESQDSTASPPQKGLHSNGSDRVDDSFASEGMPGQHRHSRPVGSNDEADSDSEENEAEPTGVLSRAVSRITSHGSIDPGPPPDGGWKAWAQCLGGHLVITVTWGWINSFGTFQTYYTEHLPHQSQSDISFIGSITVFLLFFIGTFTGRLTDAGLFRAVFLLGTALVTLGIFATSACTSYWQFILAQGLCIGLGNGCLFCPTLALVATYFQRKRAIAIGIAACGSVTGGIVFPVIVRQLLPQIGFPWTIRVVGFIMLAALVAANLLLRQRLPPRRTGPLVDWPAFKELDYTFYACGTFFCFWGLYFAFYYLAAFSRTALDDPLSFPDSLNLLLLLNGVGAVGRLVPNYLADKYGAVNIFVPVAAVCAVLMFSWIAVESAPGLYVWSVFYGMFAGGIQSLFPAALSFLTDDLRKLGVRMGMVFTIVSFSSLTGPPIAGALIDGPGGYPAAQAFAASALTLGCGFLLAAKLVKMRTAGLGWKDRV